ncbi:MAG: 16S rRNA (cytidine(1402)-2'-O)-methyltransferase [Aestuariibacter sp.]
MSGTLYIVATPIGNLQDISSRAIEVLRDVDVIAAEDTRHSARLMQHLDIKTHMVAIHEHNERQKREWLADKLLAGENIALISDAGTPLISDPGYPLVNYCRERGITITPIPGACAVITALCASGLPTDAFQFGGFLAVKSVAKTQQLEKLIRATATHIFYESPRRIIDTLNHCQKVLPEGRKLVVAKELTKSFEQFIAGTASEILDWFKANEDRLKGEFVLLIGPDEEPDSGIPEEAIRLLKTLSEELPLKKAAGIVAGHYQLKKNELYSLGLGWKGD